MNELQEELTPELISSTEITTKFGALKQSVLELSKEVKAIVIDSEVTNEEAVKLATKANKISKEIDAKRTVIKAPYFNTCKTIDAIGKELIKPLEEAVASAKQKIKIWKEQEEKRKEEELNRLQSQKAILDHRSSETLDHLRAGIKLMTDTYNLCVNLWKRESRPDEAKRTIKLWLAEMWNFDYQQHKDSAKELEVAIIAYAKIMIGQLSNDGPDRHAKQADASLDINAKFNMIIAKMYQEERTLMADFDKKNTQVVSQMINAVTETTAGGSQERWVWEVKKFTDIPLEFMQPDEDAIKKFMADNKEGIKLGTSSIPGIVFKKDLSIVLR